MKRTNIIGLWAITFALLCSGAQSPAQNSVATVQSPDGNIRIELSLDANASLIYRVSKNSQTLVDFSRMGVNTSQGDFRQGLTFENAAVEAKQETYTLPSGKKSVYQNIYNELTASFANSGRLQATVRAYNDGIAFRLSVVQPANAVILSETNECKLASVEKIYAQTCSRDYKSKIETFSYEKANCLGYFALPLLAEIDGQYVMLSEGELTGDYPAAKLRVTDEINTFRYDISGTSIATQTPWRAIHIGSLNSIVESTLLENLNPPTAIADMSWIKAGRAAWNYGGEDMTDYIDIVNIRKYIDWAQEMNWEYFTLDRGWQNASDFNLTQIVNYAATRGIGVFIHLNQNKLPSDETALRTEFQNWKNKGVKGLKIDFWESDSQTMMKKYNLALRLAAEQRLLLNFHSCTKPAGERRAYPHLLATEAVTGNDYYAANPDVVTATHNINAAIMRGSLGATDYKPADFAQKNGKINQGVTWAHQLALSVVFESGILHIADAPDNLRYHIAKGFLKTLPAAYDDTKCLDVAMNEKVTIARQKGDEWYLAALSAEAQTIDLPLAFLSQEKTYRAYIYKDGNCPSEILFEYRDNLRPTDRLSLNTLKNGGFAVILSPSDHAKPYQVKYEAEAPENILPFGVAVKNDADGLCSNGKYVAGIGKGRSLIFKNISVPQSGTYALTLYYMSDAASNAYLRIGNNKDTWISCSFAATGKNGGAGLACKTLLVELDATVENVIEIVNYSDYAPDFDRLVISSENMETLRTDIEQNAMPNNGKIYAIAQNIVIEQPQPAQYSVYNSAGQLLVSGAMADETVKIPVANRGIYFVKINHENQNNHINTCIERSRNIKVQTKKIIIP